MLSCYQNNTKTEIKNAAKDVQKLDLLYIAGRNIKYYSHFDKQFDSFLKNETIHFPSWVYT
jgi:hypothetical protein